MKGLKCVAFVAALVAALVLSALPAYAGRRERKAAVIADSGKPRTVAGGIDFQAAASYDSLYDAALNYLKRVGYMIESASRDTGQIVTEMVVTGRGKQTGTRVYVILMKDNDAATTVRVTVTEQKRYKRLQTEPWNEPEVNVYESQRVADELKAKVFLATVTN